MDKHPPKTKKWLIMNYEQMMSLIVHPEGLHAQKQAERKRKKT
jgi:hypothetical protein